MTNDVRMFAVTVSADLVRRVIERLEYPGPSWLEHRAGLAAELRAALDMQVSADLTKPVAHIMRCQDRDLGLGHYVFVVMRGGGQYEPDWSAFHQDVAVPVYAARGVDVPAVIDRALLELAAKNGNAAAVDKLAAGVAADGAQR